MAGTQSNALARTYDSLSGRNRIINGACMIAQRATATISTSAVTYAGPDRYRSLVGGTAGGSFSQAQGTLTFNGFTKNCITQTVVSAITSTTTTNYWSGISQVIEGYNCYDLVGQNISVSFIFSSNVPGTYALSVTDGVNAYSYVNTFSVAANTPTFVSFNLPTTPGGVTAPQSSAAGLIVWIGAINTGTFAATVGNTGVWSQNNYITGSSTTNWGLTIGNFISITELQVEHGNIATPFERKLITQELAACQRYFCKSYPQATFAGTNTGLTLGIQESTGSSSTATIGMVRFPVTMRASPTATVYDSAGNSGKVTTEGSNTNITPTAVDDQADSGFKVFMASVTRVSFHYTAAAEL
jgi:hypothetical protein